VHLIYISLHDFPSDPSVTSPPSIQKHSKRQAVQPPPRSCCRILSLLPQYLATPRTTFFSAVINASPAARNVANPALCSSLCLLSRACSPCSHLLIVYETPPIHHIYMSYRAQNVIRNMSRDVTHPP